MVVVWSLVDMVLAHRNIFFSPSPCWPSCFPQTTLTDLNAMSKNKIYSIGNNQKIELQIGNGFPLITFTYYIVKIIRKRCCTV